jgi:molybdopterin molybdotransferase
VPELLSLDEALDRILARASPLEAERIPVAEAGGRILGEPACAEVDLPPFPSSAMDGFAVRAADTPGTLPVAGEVAAGRPATSPLAVGTALAIATGGVVPEGADAVVPVEYVVEHDNTVEIPERVDEGANVRPRGGDTGSGDEVVAAGAEVRAAQIGALVACGLTEVVCARRPRAAVLATGTELAAPGSPLAAGQVYDSNRPMLEAELARAGAVVQLSQAVADDPSAHRAALSSSLELDLVVTSGGVSVGRHDLVRKTGGELGVAEVFWGVAVKPGKPLWFGTRGRTLVFGLPGNPVSSLVGFELFVRPAVRALQGAAEPGPRFAAGRLASAVRRNPARDQLLRARSRLEEGSVELDPLTGQESHMIARAAGADALVLVERGEGELAAGSVVRFLSLG